MFTHGIVSSALFIVVGMIYLRHNTRLIYYYQGLYHIYPVMASFFFIFILGNFGFPGTGGFIGEFLILLSLFQKDFFIGVISIISIFFSAIYSLLLYTRVFFGINLQNPIINYSCNPSLTFLEFMVLLFFGFFSIQTGIFPGIYLSFLERLVVSLI